MTNLGAINRVHDALMKWRKDNCKDPDFVIGLEVGVKKELKT